MITVRAYGHTTYFKKVFKSLDLAIKYFNKMVKLTEAGKKYDDAYGIWVLRGGEVVAHWYPEKDEF